jgi:hypothetical protein
MKHEVTREISELKKEDTSIQKIKAIAKKHGFVLVNKQKSEHSNKMIYDFKNESKHLSFRVLWESKDNYGFYDCVDYTKAVSLRELNDKRRKLAIDELKRLPKDEIIEKAIYYLKMSEVTAKYFFCEGKEEWAFEELADVIAMSDDDE